MIPYDGVCVLCNGLNAFLIPRDHGDAFRFASLQSEYGRTALHEHGKDTEDLDTFYVLSGGRDGPSRLLEKSDAGLFVLRQLGGLWRGISVLKVFPRPLRDAAYDFIAAHRYRWFGKYDACLIPSPDVRKKFIDE